MPICKTRAFLPDELSTMQAPTTVDQRPILLTRVELAPIVAANCKPRGTTGGHGLLGKLLALTARLKATGKEPGR
jgi:hypothetical protein